MIGQDCTPVWTNQRLEKRPISVRIKKRTNPVVQKILKPSGAQHLDSPAELEVQGSTMCGTQFIVLTCRTGPGLILGSCFQLFSVHNKQAHPLIRLLASFPFNNPHCQTRASEPFSGLQEKLPVITIKQLLEELWGDASRGVRSERLVRPVRV